MTFKKFVQAFLIIFLFSCNGKESKQKSEYIKNLEEKNRRLEQDLQEQLNQKDDKTQTYTPVSSPPPVNYSNSYFSIGSTEADVISVMGDPTSVMEFGGQKRFSYGVSSVVFQNGRVKEYSNYGNNLKVKYKADGDLSNSANASSDENKSSKSKWIYFSCLLKEFRDYQSHYSKIYTVNDFTDDKGLEIKNCLIQKIKFFTGTEERIILIGHEFNSLSEASAKWNNESGKQIIGDYDCYIQTFNN